MRSIGFKVLKLVRTRIGPLQGPCEQEVLSSKDQTQAVPVQNTDEGSSESASSRDPNPESRLPPLHKQRRRTPSMVPRGQVLRPGQYCMLLPKEVDAFFALADT